MAEDSDTSSDGTDGDPSSTVADGILGLLYGFVDGSVSGNDDAVFRGGSVLRGFDA